ncbi:unnamed protein product, partial [Mesorhabditis belari]|uniref:phosphatidylinositol 3-kinase n=1 Tax=Mesorhabditis belari TaxID=2138241 RepID=A0AAF3EJK0_9BILA
MVDEDEELRLALELSKKTFEDEEQMRRLHEVNLISFENPEAVKQQEKLTKIQQLLNSPVAYGWNPAFMPHSQSAGSLPSSPFPPNPQFPGPSGVQQAAGAPPLHPRKNPAQSRNTTMPIQIPQRIISPPNSYSLNTMLPTSGFSTPTSARPIQTFVLSPSPRGTLPALPWKVQFSPMPAHKSIDTFRNRDGPSNESSPSAIDESNPYVTPKRHELYLPYSMIKSPRRCKDADLIDLSSDSRDAEVATVEQIWREFDPLYVPPRKASMPPASLERVTQLSENVANTHVPSPAAIKEVTKRVEPTTPKSRPASTIVSPPTFGRTSAQDWYSIDSIQIFEKTPDVIEQFERLTKRLSRSAKCSQFFSSPIVNYMTTTGATSVKISVVKDHTWPEGGERIPFARTIETSTKIEALITEVLVSFLDESQLTRGVPVKEYGLKEYGLDEFLPEDSLLGQNMFVGKCLLMDKDVKLEIGRKVISDLNQTRDALEYKDVQQNRPRFPSPTILDAEDIRNALALLKVDMVKFEKEIKDNNPLSVAAASKKVKQHVKRMCELLCQIEPVPVHRQLQKYLLSTEETVNQSRDDFIAAIHGLISAYCKSTKSRYNVLPLKEVGKPVKKVIEVDEKVKIIVNSVHNLRPEWLGVYQHFYVTTSLFHGTENLDGHDKVIPKEVQKDAFFPYVEMSIYAHFSTELRHCPREAKLMFLLWGVRGDVAENGGLQGGYPKAEEQPLAVASLPMFDHNNKMRQGQLMVPLSKPRGLSSLESNQTRIEPWGGQPLLCSEKDAVLVITLPVYDYDVVFPDVIVEHPCVKMNFHNLQEETQELLQVLMEATEPEKLQLDDRETLWQRRQYLVNHPEALPLVLASVPTWGFGFLETVYSLLETWASLTPVQAIQLLLPQYPDLRVRSKAVEWIQRAPSDFLFNFLPQLVELLRFELYEDSALADFLLQLSYKDRRFAFELYWQLQQRVDHCLANDFSADVACYVRRCQLLQEELLTNKEAKLLCHNICLQHKLVNSLDELQRELKGIDDFNARMHKLRQMVGRMDGELLSQKVRLPILPSFQSTGIDVQKCSIFQSNAMPLKIVFRGLKSNFNIIHKDGDDMRQDSLVLQMVRLMNDIWLREKLDLRMITFRCTSVGYKKGMAELVPDCQTLCDIQKAEGGVTGALKDDVLCKWLQKHNSNFYSYNLALNNFRRSCAGWCVATYVLGIGDRHNDNILLTTMGHVFHIDFGKYMGDWQMAGGFKRDRVPFVFTKEMYIVITGNDPNSQNYQTFIDHCCNAFNHLRKNYSVITNLIKIMVCSDIPGISPDSLSFVEKNLMLTLPDSDATEQFTQMINESLESAFTRWNFLIHSISQTFKGWKTKVGTEQDGFTLSFIPQKYTKEMDGRIRQVSLLKVDRYDMPTKVYLYQLVVHREGVPEPTYVYRSFAEFHELFSKLKLKYQEATPHLDRGTVMRSNVKEVAVRRMNDIKIFVTGLLQRPEIKDDPLVYSFFHNILRDNNLGNRGELNPPPAAMGDVQVLLELSYDSPGKNLNVFVKHLRNLPILATGQSPDAYVKTYLRTTRLNDPHTANSKRKTPIVKNALNPTFNSKLAYNLPTVTDVEDFLETHILEVSVWNAGGLKDNVKMYQVSIPLMQLAMQPSQRRGNRQLNNWFSMKRLPQTHAY